MSSKEGKPILNRFGNQLIIVIESSKEQPLPTYKVLVDFLRLSDKYPFEQLINVHYCSIDKEFVPGPHICSCGSKSLGELFSFTDLSEDSILPLQDHYLLKLIFLTFVLSLNEQVTGVDSSEILRDQSIRTLINNLIEFGYDGFLRILDNGGIELLNEAIQTIIPVLQDIIDKIESDQD